MEVSKVFVCILLVTAGIIVNSQCQEISSTETELPTTESTPSDGWKLYINNKYFKLIQTFANKTVAEGLCRQASTNQEVIPTLATIKSADELKFLINYVYIEQACEQSVWIGATRELGTSNFNWVDGTSLRFDNWQVGSPSNLNQRACVVMQSKYSRLDDGDWRDVVCSGGNYVLCQKSEPWTLPQLQEALLNVQDKVAELENNPVPIGYIYSQLPGRKEPESLWPSVVWTNVGTPDDTIQIWERTA